VPQADRGSDLFVLNTLEKILENCRANLSGQILTLSE